jgi:ribosomal protein S27AE
MDLLRSFPDIHFKAGGFFSWSPQEKVIYYDPRRLRGNTGRIALLHEIGHARLGHTLYKYDMQLLNMELDAWDFVRREAPHYELRVDEAHIQDCIRSYDHWLSKRATCPTCNNFSLQAGRDRYSCFRCGAHWHVNWRKDRRVRRQIIASPAGKSGSSDN